MSVKKIFVILITIVACIIIGAFLLNTLLPNATNAVIDAVEDSIYKSTHFEFDLNSDGDVGTTDRQYGGEAGTTEEIEDSTGAGVEGWD